MFHKVLLLQEMLLLHLVHYQEDDITKLWQMRLGHRSKNGMVDLSRRGLLDGQKTSKLQFYEHFIFRK